MLSAPPSRAPPDADPLLSVTTLPRDRAGHVVVEVVGEVDARTAPVVGPCLHSEATQRGVRELLVDLTSATFLGAAGVTVLAQTYQRCRMRGVRLVLRCGGRRSVLPLLQLTGLAERVVIDPPDHAPGLDLELELARRQSPRTTARPRPGPVVTTPAPSADLPVSGGNVPAVIAHRDGVRLETVTATKEVVLSAGAIGSPQLLLLSGVGPKDELAQVGIACLLDLPDVGKHLKDHLHAPMVFEAPGVGLTMTEVAISLGPDALRAPAGPLPADAADDAGLPPELAGLKAEAERRLTEWITTGRSLVSSSLYDAGLWYSTGLGDEHTHDAQIGFLVCGYTADLWRGLFRVDPDEYFDDVSKRLAPDAQIVVLLPNPVQPHSEGEIRLASADPDEPPVISLNYFDDPHDATVMVAVMRRALDLVANWPAPGLGSLLVPPKLAESHGHEEGDVPSDDLLEDLARHYALTVYHATSTCRMGSVVDSDLRVTGIDRLRVADASVMPNVTSGNTNAPTIMIGEKAAELIAASHGMTLAETVGSPERR